MSIMNNFKFCIKICGCRIFTKTFLDLVIQSVKVISKKFLNYVIKNRLDIILIKTITTIVMVVFSVYIWYLLITFLLR